MRTVERERTGGRNGVYSEEACLAMEVRVDVGSRWDLQEGQSLSGTRLIWDLEDQAMQDWNVDLRISDAGCLF